MSHAIYHAENIVYRMRHLGSQFQEQGPWTPQFSPSLGEMREILEISVSVEAILIYAILNKMIMFSRTYLESLSSSLTVEFSQSTSEFHQPRGKSVKPGKTCDFQKVLFLRKKAYDKIYLQCHSELYYFQHKTIMLVLFVMFSIQ